MKRYIVTLLAFAFAPAIFWIAGMEFVRGWALAYCMLIAVVLAVLAYTHPEWGDQ